MLLAVLTPLLLLTPQAAAKTNTVQPPQLANVVASALKVKPQPHFPDMTANYTKMVADKAAQAELDAQRAAQDAANALVAEQATQAAERLRTAYIVYNSSYNTYQAGYGELTGSYGYALYGGNCVSQVPYALRGQGNPINWPSTSGPYIGGAVLFWYNHTGRITGFWSNGDIEIAEENAGGAPHRYARSYFRGFR